MGKVAFFENVWVTCSAASIGGSIYTSILLTVMGGGSASSIELGILLLVLTLLSFGILAVSYILFGWWITRYICQRVRFNRVLVFGMTGMLLGLVVYLGSLVILSYGLAWFFPSEGPGLDLPTDLRGWMNYGIFATIPMFYLMLTGIVTAVHQNQIEQQ